jgi:hypothetical protein
VHHDSPAPRPTGETSPASDRADEEAVFASYQEAGVTVWLPDRRVRIDPLPAGRAEGTFPFAHPVHIVTGHNPGGPVAAAVNERAHAQLLADVVARGWTWHPSIGGDRTGDAPEGGVLLVDAGRDAAVALGRRLAQDSIYEWRPDGLEIVPCLMDRSVTLGWVLVELAAWAAVDGRHPHRDTPPPGHPAQNVSA